MAKMPKKVKEVEVESEAETEVEAEAGGEPAVDYGERSHLTSKDEIATEVASILSEWGGKRSGAKTASVKAVALVFERVFEFVQRDGYFRFPNGLGALKVQEVKGGVRTVPRTGARIMTNDRAKIV